MLPWKGEVAVGNANYVYPDGPTLLNYFIFQVADGIYLVRRGDAMLNVYDPLQVAQVTDLKDHHIKITENGVVLVDEDLEIHPWNCQYTVRKNPVTIVNTPQKLIDLGLVPIYGNTGTRNQNVSYSKFVPPWDPSLKTTLLWSTSSITKYMPTTGERPDIGLFTDVESAWLAGGASDGMLAWAFSAGSFPIHWQDPKGTGLGIDVLKYPGCNAYDAEGYQGDPVRTLPSPYIIKGPRDPVSGYFRFSNGCQPQNAHFCSMSYTATIATLDPVFLLELQEEADFNIGDSAEGFTPDGRRVMAGEYRGIAWGNALLLKAWVATQYFEKLDLLIAGFHKPSSYYAQLLANTLEFYTTAMATIGAQRFGLLLDMTVFSPWQHDYNLEGHCFAALTKKTDWVQTLIHCLKNVVDRYSGKPGAAGGIYPPAWPGYYLPTRDYDGNLLGDLGAVFDHFYVSEQDNLATATAHGQSYDIQITPETYATLKADPMNGGHLMGSAGYILSTRMVFSFADYLDKRGDALIRASLPDFDAAKANVELLFKNYNYCESRTQVVSSLDKMWPIGQAPQVFEVSQQPVDTGVPGQPAAPPVNYGANEPLPDGDPTSVQFEEPSLYDAVTSKDTVFIDMTGRLPAGQDHLLLTNVQGDGKTIVYMIWPNVQAGWETMGPDTPGGFNEFIETHGSGDRARFRGCAGFILNGGSVWSNAVVPPPVVIPPIQPQEPPVSTPNSTPLSDLQTAVHAVTDASQKVKAAAQHVVDKVAAMATAAQTTGTQIDPAALIALTTELNTDIATLTASATQEQAL